MAVLLLLAVAVPRLLPSRAPHPVARPAADSLAVDQVAALRLDQAANPRAVGDYLLPNAAALTQFGSTYGDASWNYDPSWWTENNDATLGG